MDSHYRTPHYRHRYSPHRTQHLDLHPATHYQPVLSGVFLIILVYIAMAVGVLMSLVRVLPLFQLPHFLPSITPAIISVVAQLHSVPPDISFLILPGILVLALVLSYGLFAFKRWGWWLSVGYHSSVAVANLLTLLTQTTEAWLMMGNLAWSVAVVAYLISVRKWF
jgi:hypothetical protein